METRIYMETRSGFHICYTTYMLYNRLCYNHTCYITSSGDYEAVCIRTSRGQGSYTNTHSDAPYCLESKDEHNQRILAAVVNEHWSVGMTDYAALRSLRSGTVYFPQSGQNGTNCHEQDFPSVYVLSRDSQAQGNLSCVPS